MNSLHEYLRADPECRDLATGAVLAVGPLLEDADPTLTTRALDDWAHELAGRMPLPWSFHGALDELHAFLFEELCFRGASPSDDDVLGPLLLPRVLQHKHGLPLTLSILWIELARRLGFDAVGAVLPGYFVTAIRTDVGLLYFDPYRRGAPLGPEDASRLVRRLTRGKVAFDPSMLAPVTHRAILTHLVRTLHAHFLKEEVWPEALWTATHLILLQPDEPGAYRDRAFLKLHRGDVLAALEDLRMALRLGQRDPLLTEWIQRLEEG